MLLLLLLLLYSFNGLYSRTTWASRYQKDKTSLDLNEAKDDEVLGCSGISWTICKQSAPRSRQITTSTSHHSNFFKPDALPDAQPTVPKHWTQTHTHTRLFNGPLSGTTRVSWYQKSIINLDFTEARDSEWQRHQLSHMQVWTSL